VDLRRSRETSFDHYLAEPVDQDALKALSAPSRASRNHKATALPSGGPGCRGEIPQPSGFGADLAPTPAPSASVSPFATPPNTRDGGGGPAARPSSPDKPRPRAWRNATTRPPLPRPRGLRRLGCASRARPTASSSRGRQVLPRDDTTAGRASPSRPSSGGRRRWPGRCERVAPSMRPQVKLMLVVERVRSGRLEIRRDDLFDGPDEGRSLTTTARRRDRGRSRRLGGHRRSYHRQFLPPGKYSAASTRPRLRSADRGREFGSQAGKVATGRWRASEVGSHPA